MSDELALGTPLADALNLAIQSKIAELGWASGGGEVTAMSEYFILMLANGKMAKEISAEIASDILGMGPEDPTIIAFGQWLVDQYQTLRSQIAPAAASNGNGQGATETAQDDPMDASFDPSMDAMSDGPSNELNAPTGPKAMRGGNFRGDARGKRLLGHMNRAMVRTQDSVLHRTRGQSGVSRGPPSGPRMNVGRQPRTTGIRAANVAAGLVGMNGMPVGPPGMPGMNGMGPMNGMNPSFATPDILSMMEQQSRMLVEMQHQLMMQQSGGHNGHAKVPYDRARRGGGFRGRGGHHQQHNGHAALPQQPQQHAEGAQNEAAVQQGEDVEMGQAKRDLPNPEDTVCRFNLRCTNKECKFAHQSPAAPHGITIDIKDVCSFGVACKNRKCVGRHPSPATKIAHQSELDCKFFPNCANPSCPFRHPAMPPCRNGGECKVPNCKFTHIKTPCKFNPCTNRTCPFSHEEGQRGTFKDKVWVADEAKEHVSERKFVSDEDRAELILPGSGMDVHDESMPEVIV